MARVAAHPPLLKTVKTGNEPLHYEAQNLGLTVLDFWRWSVSDLVSNATRGRLAEFIVASALKIITDTVRDEWQAYDLVTLDGLKIEVKSAAYIQAWGQRGMSKIAFLVPKSRAWDPQTNLLCPSSERQADVYVFALLAHQDRETLDPLNVAQWRFYALATKTLNTRKRSQHSISLKSLEGISGGAVDYFQLAETVNNLKVVVVQ